MSAVAEPSPLADPARAVEASPAKASPAEALPSQAGESVATKESAALKESVATRESVATGESVAPKESVAAEPEPVGERDRPGWWTSYFAGKWTWAAGLAMYAAVTFVAWLPFGDAPGFAQAYQSWHRWDTTWYVIIADSGYEYDKRSAAFFPLYPLLIRWSNRILPGGSFEAALVVSGLACLAALVLVHRLTTEIVGGGGERAANGEPATVLGRRTIFYLLAFPAGFYLAAAYNESLFIALVAGSFYCMRRGRWWVAGLLAGFASATRVLGVLLAVSMLYEYMRQRRFSVRRIRVDLLALLLAPTGLVIYALYCWRTFGDPLFFQKMQENWFRSGYTAPWTTIADTYRLIVDSHPMLGADTVRNIYNLSTALLWLVLLVVALDKQWGLGGEQAYMVIFSAAVILIPLVTPIHNYYPLSSMVRFALECLPVFMLLAKWGRDRRFDRVYTMVVLALQGVMIVTFVHDSFVG